MSALSHIRISLPGRPNVRRGVAYEGPIQGFTLRGANSDDGIAMRMSLKLPITHVVSMEDIGIAPQADRFLTVEGLELGDLPAAAETILGRDHPIMQVIRAGTKKAGLQTLGVNWRIEGVAFLENVIELELVQSTLVDPEADAPPPPAVPPWGDRLRKLWER